MAQETQTGALYQPREVGWGGRWEGGSKGREYMYTYGWFMLRFDRKQQNSVKQLSFQKKIFFKNYLLILLIFIYTCVCAHAQSLSRGWLFVTPWTTAHQASLSMGFSRQEYWSGLPFLPSEDLPNPGNQTLISKWLLHCRQILYHWATEEAQEVTKISETYISVPQNLQLIHI